MADGGRARQGARVIGVWFPIVWTVGVVAAGVLALRRILRAKRERDRLFVEGAAMFARQNGGWPCRACITANVAGFCTHRTPYEDGPQP